MKKVILSLFLGGVAASAFAQGPTSTIPANTVIVGAHVLRTDDAAPGTKVPIYIANPASVAGVQVKLFYNPAVATAVEDPDAKENENTVIPGALAIVNYNSGDDKNGNKSIQIAIASSKGSTTSGQIARVYFAPAAGAKAGDNTPLNASADPNDFVVSNDQAQQINTASVINGSITIGGAKASTGSVTLANGVSGSVGLGFSATNATQVFAVDNKGQLFRSGPAVTNVTGQVCTDPTDPSTCTPFPAGTAGSSGRPVVNAGTLAFGTGDGKVVISKQDFSAAAVTKTVTGSVNASPAILNNIVYVVGTNANQATLYAFSAADGSAVGPAGGVNLGPAVAGAGNSSPSVAPGGLAVFVGGGDGVYKVSPADLTPLTDTKIGTGGVVQSSPEVVGTLGVVGSDDGKVYGFDAATGTAIGTPYDTTSPVSNSPYIIPAGLAPGVTGIVAVVVNNAGQVHLVNVSPTAVAGVNGGAITLGAGATIGAKQSPIVVGSTLYVGDSAGVLHTATVSATAATNIKNIAVSTKPLSSPAAANGTVYVASEDGSIVGIPAAP